MTKTECRRVLTGHWNSLSAVELDRISSRITRRILGSPEWKNSGTVLAFLSFGQEISLDSLIREGLREGKTVAVPQVRGRRMHFTVLEDWDPGRFILNRWGIRETPGDTPELEEPAAGLILVPGLGFTARGERMGRGGGYYDRFLGTPGQERMITMGVTWSRCLLTELPTEEQDIPVRAVCTEEEIIRP